MKEYTVIGFYADTEQRYAACYRAQTPEIAEILALCHNVQTLTIVGTLEGRHALVGDTEDQLTLDDVEFTPQSLEAVVEGPLLDQLTGDEADELGVYDLLAAVKGASEISDQYLVMESLVIIFEELRGDSDGCIISDNIDGICQEALVRKE